MQGKFLTLLLIICGFITIGVHPVTAKDQWINLQTKNFNIVSNADDGETRKLAFKLEQFRTLFASLVKLPESSPVPLTVVVFKNEGDFKPFKPLYNGKPINAAGYFQKGEDENIIALDISANQSQSPFRTIFHEYTHLLTSYSKQSYPLWLTEGIAEFYSTYIIEKKKITIGTPIINHVRFLREQSLIPLSVLLKVEHDSPIYNETDKQGVFYAESWALVHYLQWADNGKRAQQLVKFIQLYWSGTEQETAFKEAFGTDFKGMEKELHQYVERTNFNTTSYDVKIDQDEKSYQVSSLTEAEGQYYLGDLLLRTGRVDEAEKYFQHSLTLDANCSLAYQGLGFIAMRRKDYHTAQTQFAQSVQKNNNFLAHFYYAESMLRELNNNNDAATIKKIAVELNAVIKMMPNFAPAYHALGFLCLMANKDLPGGEQLLSTALRIEPQNHQFALTLAQLQTRLKKFTEAKQTLAPLLNDDTTKVSALSLIDYIDSLSQQAGDSQPSGMPAAEKDTVEPAVGGTIKGNDKPRLKRNSETPLPPDQSQQ